MLDLDALGADEGVSWVWGGSTLLDEGPGTRKSRVMVRLSRGGSDATVAREFDLDEKRFIPESEGGFVLPEAKSRMSYKDANTLIVGGVFGGGLFLLLLGLFGPAGGGGGLGRVLRGGRARGGAARLEAADARRDEAVPARAPGLGGRATRARSRTFETGPN